MAQLGQQYSTEGVGDMNSFEPLPAGAYVARIVESEIKDASTGAGNRFLTLVWEVMSPQASMGSKIFVRLNLWNTNSKAVDIAQRELAAICRAVGKNSIADSNELHGIPATVTLKVTPAKGGYGPGNQATKYESSSAKAPVGAPAGTATAATTTTAPVQETAGADAPPWA